MDYTIKNFIPEPGFSIHTPSDCVGNSQPKNTFGVEIPKINIDKIKTEIDKTLSKLWRFKY